MLFNFVPRVVTNQVFPTPGIKDPVLPTCVVFYVTPHVTLTQLQKRQYMKHHTNYHQSTVINMYANVYIGVTIQKLHQLSDDRITRETLSNNNPCPSSPSSTILRSAYMALNTLQQDWLL